MKKGHVRLRVIAGEHKGRTIRSIKSSGTRPTSDKVREAIFSSLAETTRGARVLDLYAGSGAFGIEALSRGADSATFVDEDPDAVEVIEDNLSSIGLTSRSKLLRSPVQTFLASSSKDVYDLVFLDPPYDSGLPWQEVVELRDAGLLAPRAVLVVETAKRHLPCDPPLGFALKASRSYGDTAVIYLTQEVD